MASRALFDPILSRRKGLFDEDFPTGALFDPLFAEEDAPILITDVVFSHGPTPRGSHIRGSSGATSRIRIGGT